VRNCPVTFSPRSAVLGTTLVWLQGIPFFTSSSSLECYPLRVSAARQSGANSAGLTVDQIKGIPGCARMKFCAEIAKRAGGLHGGRRRLSASGSSMLRSGRLRQSPASATTDGMLRAWCGRMALSIPRGNIHRQMHRAVVRYDSMGSVKSFG
jgi:hypothetical protein